MPTTISGSDGVTTPTGAVYNSIQSKTAVASTSGTSIDFTGIPSWVKRITVMFNGVSTNGSNALIVQLGSGSFVTSGYVSGSAAGTGSTSVTSGLACSRPGVSSSSSTYYGSLTITFVSSNVWISSGNTWDGTYVYPSAGGISLGGVLDRVRITSVGSTDTFDAGSINILYE